MKKCEMLNKKTRGRKMIIVHEKERKKESLVNTFYKDRGRTIFDNE